MVLSRRHLIATATACAALPHMARALTPDVITWKQLIPDGVPYSEIIAEGEMDEASDYWRPVFDENATKLNPEYDGAYIKIPGFIIPIEMSIFGVTSFVLVPYVGACLHTPPPPANQLIFVTTKKPWPNKDLWAAVWVTGQMRHDIQSTEIADTGYTLAADDMEPFTW